MLYCILLGLLLLFFLALGARSLKSFSRHKLEEFCKQRRADARLKVILKNYDRVAGAVTLVRIIVSSVFIGVIVHHIPQVCTFSSAAVLIGYLFLFLTAVFYFPRAVAGLWGTYFVYFTWKFWHLLAFLASPLMLIDRFISVFFRRLADAEEETDEDDFEEEIRTIVTEGHREGLLEDDAREIIEGAMKLRDVTVSEVMTPRTDMKCIADTLSWDEMLQFVSTCPHSRIPVYKETRDDIVGVLLTKNLLRELAIPDASQHRHWTKLLSEPVFVPETKPIDALLKEFQNVRGHIRNGHSTESGTFISALPGHLAIVLDEYGGVAGLVTLEDLLEEIVGEITDEHDTLTVEAEIVQMTPGIYNVLGKVRIDDLNERLGLHLPEEEDYDTAAGYMFSTLGHIPEKGESVNYEWEGKAILLTAVEVNKRRIEKIRIEGIDNG
ncbi:MAG: hemolysin family protein [Planctomycetaceae bacterium]|jgi:CBS domain containing-hemolysin-like protein|nr:hemolysin family protein [Planctomycetaceae bacterium]